MQNEKYKNWIYYTAAYFYRSLLQARLSHLVSWNNISQYEEGCTIIMGMASRLPDILPANLSCLSRVKWSDIKQTIITVDTLEENLSPAFEENIRRQFPELNIKFVYYNQKQYDVAEKLNLPYVYAWLSWTIALNECQTKTAFIHDYDALILKNTLEKRYKHFVESGVKIQGIMWYKTNGIVPEDKLSSTFESFVDIRWIKQHPPLQMFNQVGILNGRRVDFDTLLYSQYRFIPQDQRTIMTMGPEELVHPTQMIHQYTMTIKFPNRPWRAYIALTMIPFFYYLSGKRKFLIEAAKNIRDSESKSIDLLGNGIRINFSRLTSLGVNNMLKNMLQVCLSLHIAPFGDLIEYGNALYCLTETPSSACWKENFSSEQKDWITSASCSS